MFTNNPGTVRRLLIRLLIVSSLAGLSACSGDESRAKKAVEDHLKGQNVQKVAVDLFCSDPGLQDQAYIAVTVTYNFGDASGTPQREYLAYVLKQSGETWNIVRNVSYTKEKPRALSILGGSK